MNKAVVGILVLSALWVLWWASGSGAESEPREDSIGALVPDEAPPAVEPALAGELPARAPDRVAQGEVPPAPEVVVLASPIRMPRDGLIGRVRRSDGEPAGRRNVQLAVIGGGVRTPMEGTWTTEDGHYACAFDMDDLAELAPEIRTVSMEAFTKAVPLKERLTSSTMKMSVQEFAQLILEPIWLEVSVQDPQGFRAEKRIELRPGLRGPLRVDLMIRPRYDLEGDVLGEHGNAAFANVALFDADWNLLATTRADDKGAFRLSSPPAGRFVVHARQSGGGAAQIAGNFLGDPFRAPRQQILLAGGTALLGKVVTPTGEPVINLPVIGIEVGLAEEIYPSVVPSVAELAQAETLGGLAHSTATTNRKGEFEMGAMQAGTYRVRFGTMAEKYQPQNDVLTGSSNTFVFAGDLLTVSLEEGSEALLRVQVHCLQADWKSQDAGDPIAHFVQPAIFGVTQFVLEPGQTWLVFATLDGQYSQEEKVSFDARNRYEEVDLAFSHRGFGRSRSTRSLPPVHGMATLDVSVRDGKGKRQKAQVQLWRKEGSGRVQVLEAQRLPLNGELRDLPPGEYELLVESLLDKDMFVPVRRAVTLQAGETESAELTTEVAGRLKLQFDCEGGVPGYSLGARAIPIDTPQAPIPLTFISKRGGGEPQTSMSAWDTAICSPALAPGVYKLSLSATSSEFELPLTTFEIEAGKTLSADIELLSKD